MNRVTIKYCPICGSESFRRTGHRYDCFDCGFEYYFNVAAACAAIIEYKDQIIATVRKHDPEKGKLDLPGGFVSRRETMEDAIRREIKEELNLELGPIRYIGSSHNRYLYNRVTYHTLDAFFVAHVDCIEEICIDDDISDYRLIPISEFSPDFFPFESIKEGVKMYFRHREQVV